MAVRATFRAMGRMAPGTAARWAEELFFRPRKAQPRANEEEFLTSGRRFSFQSSRGALAAWTWALPGRGGHRCWCRRKASAITRSCGIRESLSG